VGRSLCERDLATTAQRILATAKVQKCEVVLPVDAVVAKAFKAGVQSRAVSIDAVGADSRGSGTRSPQTDRARRPQGSGDDGVWAIARC
jgi:3-phosphoglycerate kinase